jgi:hypothetical protein
MRNCVDSGRGAAAVSIDDRISWPSEESISPFEDFSRFKDLICSESHSVAHICSIARTVLRDHDQKPANSRIDESKRRIYYWDNRPRFSDE